MQESIPIVRRNAQAPSGERVRISKNGLYESPCVVTGSTKRAGSKLAPKDICTDRTIGTSKAG